MEEHKIMETLTKVKLICDRILLKIMELVMNK
jgi:hypothetical protein